MRSSLRTVCDGCRAPREPVPRALLVDHDRRRVGLRRCSARSSRSRARRAWSAGRRRRPATPDPCVRPRGSASVVQPRCPFGSLESRPLRLADGRRSALLAHQRAEVGHAPAGPIWRITVRTWPNCLTSWLTACTLVPEPRAIRRRREPLISSGRRRSCGRHREDDRLDPVELALVDLDAAQLRADARQHPEQPLERPHPAHRAQLVEEVLEVELAARAACARAPWPPARRPRAPPSRSASARRPCRGSAAPCGRGGSARTASSFSPVEANRIGMPVTARTDSAAPPRASPSSLVRITPSRPTAAANCSATLTASWPVIASTTSSVWSGWVAVADRAPARPSAPRRRAAGRRCRRSARPCRRVRARSSAQRAISTAGRVGALLVDGRAGALAHHDELLDGRRALHVAGRDRHRAAVLAPQQLRELGRRPSSCPSPAGRPSGSRSAGSTRTRCPALSPPIIAVSSSSTILTTCWPGFSLPSTSAPRQRSRTALGELLDDLEVDVRLEQREADLAHRARRRRRSVRTPRPRRSRERRLELLGEGVEHAVAAADAGAHCASPSAGGPGGEPSPSAGGAHRPAERLADPGERLRELGRDHEHLVGLALGELRQHLQVLVGEQLAVGVAGVDRLEHRRDRLRLALGAQDRGLALALGGQDRRAAARPRRSGSRPAWCPRRSGSPRGGRARRASASPSPP